MANIGLPMTKTQENMTFDSIANVIGSDIGLMEAMDWEPLSGNMEI